MPGRGYVLLWKTLIFWKRKSAGDRVVSCLDEASSSMVPERYQWSSEDLVLSGTNAPYGLYCLKLLFRICHRLHGPISADS